MGAITARQKAASHQPPPGGGRRGRGNAVFALTVPCLSSTVSSPCEAVGPLIALRHIYGADLAFLIPAVHFIMDFPRIHEDNADDNGNENRQACNGDEYTLLFFSVSSFFWRSSAAAITASRRAAALRRKASRFLTSLSLSETWTSSSARANFNS